MIIDELNDIPPAEFNTSLLTAFSVIIKDDAASTEEARLATDLTRTVCELATELTLQTKELIISIDGKQYTKEEMQLATELATKSRQYFDKVMLRPAIEQNLIALMHPETPNHPKQKYYLTDLGKAVRDYLMKEK